MQITDMLNQYNRNIANGTEVSGGTQGIRQVVSSLSEMSVGNIFEGSVNQIEDGIVTLGLSDGKTIQARLDSGVSVQVGESMFFQVKSNSGAQIAIRPYSNGISTNPTLLNALEAANLQVSGKTLTMVNAMMEQSMSIDKQSLSAMARLVMGNEGMDVTSIVQMTKLGIPVTEEMAAQFENYKSDQYAILNQLESVMELLPEQLSGGSFSQQELLELNQQMVKIFLGEGQNAEGVVPDAAQNAEAVSSDVVQNAKTAVSDAAGESAEAVVSNAAGENAEAVVSNAAGENTEAVASNVSGENAKAVASNVSGENAGAAVPDAVAQNTEGIVSDVTEQNAESVISDGAAQNVEAKSSQGGQNADAVLANTQAEQDALKNLLSGKDLNQLSVQLGKIPELAQNQTLFPDGSFHVNITSRELLQLLDQTFSSQNPFTRQALSELVSSKEYRSLVRNVMEQQWLIQPEELKSEHKVNELYERLNRQLEQIEKVLKNFGQNTTQLSNTASDVRSNIQFMNQLNQTFAYVQIPLKLAGQNAHSDLYVYTDRRKRQEKDGELTAFLHLDLEHLGSTDVSIKLYQRKVSTNFYLADDKSYQLILEHMDLLEKRLEEKGYQAKIQVINQEEKVNFVEDLLKQGTPSVGGMVHRYSFDVRA